MDPIQSMGKMVLLLGVLLIVVGGLMLVAGKIPGIGKLPGDIFIQRGNFTFFFPVVSMILISVVLTLIINIFLRR
ncbi:DUF2905 domain-containing protein [Peptococcaceae bacterium 1198_IL3148]